MHDPHCFSLWLKIHAKTGMLQVNRNKKLGRSVVHRVSYMSAHVLLNLLNELGKSDKMQGLLSILSFFRNKFNKFNNTGA